MTKSEFLATLKAERARIDGRLAQMTEAQLTERAAPGTWSVKDNLAHLAYWERYMLERVRRALGQGEVPDWVDDEEERRLNAQVFEDNQDRPLAEVLEEMRQSFHQVVAQVEALSEADLTDIKRFTWLNGGPLWKYIADETYAEHYHEHLGF